MLEAIETLSKYYGATITDVKFAEDKLTLTFGDDVVEIWDDGQDCCESRYMTCDDDIEILKDKRLEMVALKDADIKDNDKWDVHEIQFLEVRAGWDSISIATHNEHNGYYGGFSIRAKEYKRCA